MFLLYLFFFGVSNLNIYIGNLPYATTGQELQDIFSSYGEVKSAKIIIDRETGRSKGFGFVEMDDQEANTAIEDLHGAEYNGKQLTVNEARDRKPMNGGGRGFNNRPSGNGGGNRKSW